MPLPCRSHAVPLPRPYYDLCFTLATWIWGWYVYGNNHPGTARGSNTKPNDCKWTTCHRLYVDLHKTISVPRCSYAVTLPQPCDERAVKSILGVDQGIGRGTTWYVWNLFYTCQQADIWVCMIADTVISDIGKVHPCQFAISLFHHNCCNCTSTTLKALRKAQNSHIPTVKIISHAWHTEGIQSRTDRHCWYQYYQI
jgi:hypothetical protein